MDLDELYMSKCLKLAERGKGYVSPNPLVGCVIVKDRKIIATGYHHKFGDKHAEIDALDKLRSKGISARGATLYVNLEPCCFYGKTPPCSLRIIKEGIKKVVIGVRDPNPKISGKSIKQFKKQGIKVIENILKEDCILINQTFFKWIKTGLPYVTLKIAQSKDGFVAYNHRRFKYITNLKSRREVHKMRIQHDAVLIGKNTALMDNPSLTVRHVKGRQPKRIVLDTNGELLFNKKFFNSAKLLNDKYKSLTLWVVNKDLDIQKFKNINILQVDLKENGRLDLKQILLKLAEQNISSILLEGGPTIWEDFLNNNLVDQFVLFKTAKEINQGIPAFRKIKLSDLKFIKKFTKKFATDTMFTGYFSIYK
jgi:diaminohydroxyphosphoribosylaminopyrimidine deaminase/5-amino-6-(5-phosphoribosylamino)uracil reductase